MRSLIMVVAITSALGCKGKGDKAAAPASQAAVPAAPADAVESEAAPATAAPAPIGEGPCIGIWSVELARWGKGQCATDDREVARKLLVVRAPDGKGYQARRDEGLQDLVVLAHEDTAERCKLDVMEMFSHRRFTSELAYTLTVSAGDASATGRYSESELGDDDEDLASCERTFEVKATRTPITPAELALDPAQVATELAQLWDGDRPLTLKEFCSELPAMKTALPRKAVTTVTIDAAGRIEKLVIDGVDQGSLDEVCSFPMALEEADPIGLTNRSGVPQTVTVELEPR